MRRAQRLRQRREFAAVYRRGRPYRNELLVLRALRRDGPVSRFGFTVGRALGSAVARNRIKRRLREAARSLPVVSGWDIVINARQGAAQADYWKLRGALVGLLSKAGLLQSEGQGSTTS